MTCGHWDKATPSDSPFANLSRDEVRALAKTSLTEHRFKDDPEFGNILNRIREGCRTAEDIAAINTRTVA